MGGSVPCPLCLGIGFSHMESLFNSLLTMYRQDQVCPDPSCAWRGQGFPQLIEHVFSLHSPLPDNFNPCSTTQTAAFLLETSSPSSPQTENANFEISQFLNLNLSREARRKLNSIDYSSILEAGRHQSIATEAMFYKLELDNASSESDPCVCIEDFLPDPHLHHPPLQTESNLSLEKSTFPPSISSNSTVVSSSPASSTSPTSTPPTLKTPGVQGPRQSFKILDRIKGKQKIGRQLSSEHQHVECKECGWMFDNAKFLSLHRILMHSYKNSINRGGRVEKYSCPHCSAEFGKYDTFHQHLFSVHGDTRHVCRYCSKSFKLRGSLLVHQRVIHQTYQNQHLLSKTESTETEDSQSPRVELQQGDGVADSQGDQIPSEKDVSDEEEMASGEQLSDNLNFEKGEILSENEPSVVDVCCDRSCSGCLVCNKPYTYKLQPELHQQRSHPDSKQFECNVCTKKFTTKYFLKKHRRLHTGETPYSCDLCGKTFSFQQSYHKHMLYHSADKPYSCATCGRAFKELSTLQNHERIHSGERPFVCENCGKSFRQRVSYLVHRRIHTGVLPYVCELCGKKFRYKVTQRTHKCAGKSDASAADTSTSSSQSVSSLLSPAPQQSSFLHDNFYSQLEDVENKMFSYRDPSSPASPKTTYSSPCIPPEIKQNLLNFRRAQGKRQLGHRLQNILERSRRKSIVPEAGVVQHLSLVQPIRELQHLSLLDPGGQLLLHPGEEGGQLVLHPGEEGGQLLLHPGEEEGQLLLHPREEGGQLLLHPGEEGGGGLSHLEMLLGNAASQTEEPTADSAIKEAIENFDITALQQFGQ